MCWKMIRSEGWRFLFMNFQVNIIRKFFKRTRDASPICLLLRSICTGLSYLALSEPLILKKLIGFIPLYTPPVTWHQMASLYPLSHHEWWEVQYNLFLQTGLIGTEQRELIISLWFPMILRLVFITKYEFRIQFLKFIVHITLSATLSIPILHIYHVTCSFFFYYFVPGREGNWKRDSSTAATCHLGTNIWTEESCVLERWLNYHSSLCSATENAYPLDSW